MNVTQIEVCFNKTLSKFHRVIIISIIRIGFVLTITNSRNTSFKKIPNKTLTELQYFFSNASFPLRKLRGQNTENNALNLRTNIPHASPYLTKKPTFMVS